MNVENILANVILFPVPCWLVLAVPLTMTMGGIFLTRLNMSTRLRYRYLVPLFGNVMYNCTPEHGNEIIR